MTPDKTITIDGVQIAYTERGKGRPVVFVHGFGAYSYTWNELLPLLPKKKYRYLMLDLKGFGYSEKPDDHRYTPYHQAKILGEFIRKLRVKNGILIGHSYGGAVALFYLLLAKRKVRTIDGLILIDSAGYFKTLPNFIKKLRTPITNNIALSLFSSEQLAKSVLDEVFYDRRRLKRRTIVQYAKALRLPGAKLGLLKSAQQITSRKVSSFHERFKNIYIPTLIIWGGQDRVIPVSDAHRFRTDMAEAQVAIIPQCGHSPHEELPKETAGIIRKFFKEV